MRILHISRPKMQKKPMHYSNSNPWLGEANAFCWAIWDWPIFQLDCFARSGSSFIGNTGPGDFSGKILDKGEMKVRYLIKDWLFCTNSKPLPKNKILTFRNVRIGDYSVGQGRFSLLMAILEPAQTHNQSHIHNRIHLWL